MLALLHPQFDPVALKIGPLALHWYGLMYLLAFAQMYALGRLRLHHPGFQAAQWRARDLEDLLFFGALGVILGGRLGYVIFYKPLFYLEHPLEILYVWQGGMSFHGGLLGVLIACALFAWQRRRREPEPPTRILEVTDFVVPLVPLGLAFGRLGNFINGELWGREASTDLPWAMIFPQSGSHIARHPSQLYQLLLEGLLLFVLLWLLARRAPPQPAGRISGYFLLGYGVLRFCAEFFREPDGFLGLLALDLSMGQWLTLPMILLGLWLARPQSMRRSLL